MIKEYQFSFKELGITNKDIEELMGFENGVIPDPFPELIQQALANAPSICNIRGGYKIFGSNECKIEKHSVNINGHVFNPSKIVITQFKHASSFAIFVCTAGKEITEHSKRISENGDPVNGYVFDIIGSVAVDKATDQLQEKLEEEIKTRGLSISDRFSPGYCEWSVSEQHLLFDLLPVDFCGISLSKSALMSPIKSVSGIIGIGNHLKKKGYQCFWCSEKDCIYGIIRRQKMTKKKP